MPASLIIRADANTAIGTGHVMRCLALAEAWLGAGGRLVFASICDNEALMQRISNAGAEVVHLLGSQGSGSDIAQTWGILEEHPRSVLLLDGYGFDAAYHDAVRGATLALVVIDDFAHLARYSADMVINQNLGASDYRYACAPETEFLLGADYVLLRNEFISRRDPRHGTRARATRILVTLGGSDPSNVTGKVVRALKHLDRPEIEGVVVVGAANPNRAEIEEEIRAGPAGLRIHTDVSNMAELMAWADVAVSAGGTTCWELAFMGLPNAIIVLADNQRDVARALTEAGVSVLLGEAEDAGADSVAGRLSELMEDGAKREQMSARGRALVDGNGARRVVDAITAYRRGRMLSL